MRVFNLTDTAKIYKGKPIPPNGGFVDFPGLEFIPDRDRALETKRILAFGALPKWWLEKKAKPAPKPSIPAPPKNGLVSPPPKVEVKTEIKAEAKVEVRESVAPKDSAFVELRKSEHSNQNQKPKAK